MSTESDREHEQIPLANLIDQAESLGTALWATIGRGWAPQYQVEPLDSARAAALLTELAALMGYTASAIQVIDEAQTNRRRKNFEKADAAEPRRRRAAKEPAL